MTWAQTITIVVPILFAIVAGIFYNNRQTDLIARVVGDLRTDMNARFAGVDSRFASIDARFVAVEGRLGGLDGRLDRLEAKFDRRFEKVDEELRDLHRLLLDVLKPKAS